MHDAQYISERNIKVGTSDCFFGEGSWMAMKLGGLGRERDLLCTPFDQFEFFVMCI